MDIYQIVTDKILAQLEAGAAPWVRPWKGSGSGVPYNAISKKPYRGINAFLLYAPPGGSGDGWMTYNQAQGVGGQVRKGEKGSMVVFFKPWVVKDKNDPNSKMKSIPILRYFTVFHTSQIDNLPEKYLPVVVKSESSEENWKDFYNQRIEAVDKLMSQAKVEHGGARAFYCPSSDHIQLPAITDFKSMQDYYATALHELTHWSGAATRLARQYGKRFGDSAYAREELVAEMGAAYLCAATGIEGKLQHVEYLASWIKVLKEDKRAIVMAASAAQKAADFLQGKPAFSAKEEDTSTESVAA